MFNFFKKFFKLGDSGFVVPTESPSVVGSLTPITNESTTKVFLGEVKGASNLELAMTVRSVFVMDQIIISDEFKDEVLKSLFTSTNGLTNQQIYNTLTDEPIIMNVTFFTGSFVQNRVYKTVGLDNGSGIVYANRFFVQNVMTLTSLMMHEFAHQKGFHHKSASEKTSVPYMMNTIFDAVYKKVIK